MFIVSIFLSLIRQIVERVQQQFTHFWRARGILNGRLSELVRLCFVDVTLAFSMDSIELDPASHMAAVQNVNANGMQDRVSVEKAEADGKVLFLYRASMNSESIS